MDKPSLIEYAKSIGAYATMRSFGAPKGQETVCVFVGEQIIDDIHGYEHAVFVEKNQESWFIGYSLAGRTRALNESELKELLASWVKKPESQIFHAFEMSCPSSTRAA